MDHANPFEANTFCGLDNGNSAFLCALHRSGKVEFHPVPLYEVGGLKVVDDFGLRDLIQSFDRPFVGWEFGNIQPAWGAKGNWVNSANCFIVRGVLRHNKIPSRSMEAKEWQAALFKGLRGFAQVKGTPTPDPGVKAKERAGLHPTKLLALEYCRNTYPNVSLREGPRSKLDSPDMADALCIATYTRSLCLGGGVSHL